MAQCPIQRALSSERLFRETWNSWCHPLREVISHRGFILRESGPASSFQEIRHSTTATCYGPRTGKFLTCAVRRRRRPHVPAPCPRLSLPTPAEQRAAAFPRRHSIEQGVETRFGHRDADCLGHETHLVGGDAPSVSTCNCLSGCDPAWPKAPPDGSARSAPADPRPTARRL